LLWLVFDDERLAHDSVAGRLPFGSASAAEQHARAALTVAESLRGDAAHSAWTGRSQLALGRAREALGDTAEARKLFGEAARHLAPMLGEGHPVLNEARQRAAGAP
jgi:hypothetical protein